jgi:hypothetical protein
VIANKIFKNLKGTFEGLKDVLNKIEKNRMHQTEINDLKILLQQKEAKSFSEEIRLKQMQDLQIDQIRNRHQTDLQDLQVEEDLIVDKEITGITDELTSLENQYMLTESRLHNIKQEKKLIQESLVDYNKFIEHVQSLQKVFTWKGGEENQEMENL